MSAVKRPRANERSAARGAVLGARPREKRGGRCHGRWACGGAEGARGTAAARARVSSRDWPWTLSRGGGRSGAARACEQEHCAPKEPGSRWPLQGTLPRRPAGPESRVVTSGGAVTPPGTFSGSRRARSGRRTFLEATWGPAPPRSSPGVSLDG
ncbi:hypothetical protein SUZIE_184925 [Sciurus carolinensis]|uniref:Uncharacterized protein n=1 Tax=Sciurus carolinensis TaxID=30640 RepID=A0AA41N8Z0_SCICA|nr:hypothetical protein [Sciurus carolinensis]